MEQYCLQPAQGQQFGFEGHELYGTWEYNDCAALAKGIWCVELNRANPRLNRILGFTTDDEIIFPYKNRLHCDKCFGWTRRGGISVTEW